MDPVSEAPASFEFGRFKVSPHRREVLADGRPIELGGRAFDVLVALLRAEGAVVGKHELMSCAWPGRTVEENNLRAQVKALRKALGDRSLIRTIAGRGYQLAREVRSRAPELRVEPAADAVPDRARADAPRLSIVVLPFVNLSDDREQQYFADGITEDLTTDLSRLAGMFVISRHTSFAYRDKPVDTKQIGRELGVRYALEGSVQRSGDRVRVNVQLIDAETDAHLWAERFEGGTGDLFGLQNEITSRIAVALDVELVGAEAARPAARPDALDYILRGRALHLGRLPTRRNYVEQIALFERALALDPSSLRAQSYLATALTARVLDQLTDTAEADVARAQALAGSALAAFPRSAHAHYAQAQVLRATRRFDEAIPEYETVIALNRNWVHAIAALGFCKLVTGSIEEAIPAQERAIRLSPRDPRIWVYYLWTGQPHLLRSRVEQAILWFEKARGAYPEHPQPRGYLASAYGLKGETGLAAAELAQARRLSGDDRYSTIARLKALGPFERLKIRDLFEATYIDGLRKAGMPEE